jgi:hypothetical protein
MLECLRPGGWLIDEDGDWGTLGPVNPPHPCYARFQDAYRGGEWWTSRGYDPTLDASCRCSSNGAALTMRS